MSNRKSPDDYDDDMKRAKAAGIDAFALNIGIDPYTDEQLMYAYRSAARNDMKVFISFDFNWWQPKWARLIGSKIERFSFYPSQLKVDNKIFASSFGGDGVDVKAIASAAKLEIFFVPNFHPNQGSFDSIQGAFNWMAWPNDGNNKAPSGAQNISVSDGDQAYLHALGGKPYMAREFNPILKKKYIDHATRLT